MTTNSQLEQHSVHHELCLPQFRRVLKVQYSRTTWGQQLWSVPQLSALKLMQITFAVPTWRGVMGLESLDLEIENEVNVKNEAESWNFDFTSGVELEIKSQIEDLRTHRWRFKVLATVCLAPSGRPQTWLINLAIFMYHHHSELHWVKRHRSSFPLHYSDTSRLYQELHSDWECLFDINDFCVPKLRFSEHLFVLIDMTLCHSST